MTVRTDSRIGEAFERIRTERRPGLVTFVTAGDPTLERSEDVLVALDRGGADVIEVGVPFSDPMADGPAIQRATERALAGGGSLRASLALVARVRDRLRAPVVLFSYANPILRFGVEPFADRAAEAGVDGVLVLDLPIEEAGDVRDALAARGLDTIFLLSPTTTDARIGRAAELGRGFLYGISRLGVTGARDQVADSAETLAARIRRQTTMPVALGFGVSRPEHVTHLCRHADAAVVGSALVSLVGEIGDAPELGARLERRVRWLRGEDVQA